jgi:UDP-N-acetylglucosamine 2-epimerase (non-hydrolysing)
MRVLTVVGARPNFMKAAPIIAAIGRHNKRIALRSGLGPGAVPIRHMLVHTGQHYDDRMSGSFFSDLELPEPDVYLGVGSGSHAVQTAEIMRKFEPVILDERPNAVIVVGDVNSTLACALVASKISYDGPRSRPLIAHVEAGLRSFDRSMPEEVNRVMTDHLSDLLFVTEQSGIDNLRREGISPGTVHFVGNTMIDSLLAFQDKAETSMILEELGLRTRPYALMTLHRPSNVDDRETFMRVLAGIEELAEDYPIVFPVHPRTRRRLEEFGLRPDSKMNVVLTDPVGYLDFLCLMKHAAIVVTDSGGVQEETTCLGIPCVTVRENTERPITVSSGTNVIAGTDTRKIRDAIQQQIGRRFRGRAPEKWDGRAAERILDALLRANNDAAALAVDLAPERCA